MEKPPDEEEKVESELQCSECEMIEEYGIDACSGCCGRW